MPQFKDIGNALATLAPTIAGFFGGPLASMGVSEVEKVFGIQPSATPISDRQQNALAALAGATPEQIVALKQADTALKQKFADAGVQLAETEEADRVSARDLQKSTKSYTAPILAWMVVIGTFVGEWYAMTHSVPPEAQMIVGKVLGTLDTALIMVLTFYFGDSAGHAETKAMLNKALSQ